MSEPEVTVRRNHDGRCVVIVQDTPGTGKNVVERGLVMFETDRIPALIDALRVQLGDAACYDEECGAPAVQQVNTTTGAGSVRWCAEHAYRITAFGPDRECKI